MRKICLLLGIIFSFCFTLPALSDEWNGIETLPQGYVLCETLTMYENADNNSKKLMTIPYGEQFAILGDPNDEWVSIVYNKIEGCVRSAYIIVDPEFYATDDETAVYAMPTETSPRVALLPDQTECIVIGEYEGYIVISLRGAAGFIQKK